MKFNKAIDLFIADMRSYSRISSDETERTYRHCLDAHSDDIGNRDPKLTGRDDVTEERRDARGMFGDITLARLVTRWEPITEGPCSTGEVTP